jgi:hypothetical protein
MAPHVPLRGPHYPGEPAKQCHEFSGSIELAERVCVRAFEVPEI